MSVSRRVAVGWAAGWVALGAAYLWAADTNPGSPHAVGGEPHRTWLLTIALLLPILLTAWRLGRLDDASRTAAWVLPLVLASAVAVLMGAIGFIPDDFVHCATLADAGITLPPRCITSEAARMGALIEASGLWLAFGVAALAARRWVPRETDGRGRGHTAGMG